MRIWNYNKSLKFTRTFCNAPKHKKVGLTYFFMFMSGLDQSVLKMFARYSF
jgi:hypothetical protein